MRRGKMSRGKMSSGTELYRCPNCGRETAFDIGVHTCGTGINNFGEPTIKDLLARIERLEHNQRELLKALRTRTGEER